jgi:hypothetical protein
MFAHLKREWASPQKSYLEWEHSGAFASGRIVKGSFRPGNDADRIFWFVQVSDIHINQYGFGSGTEHLEYFLRETLPLIKPLFVVATGDLTDAKQNPGLGSQQHQQEWETYRSLLQRAGVYEKPNFWFDIRGNHDCFDVSSWDDDRNMFAHYSKMKLPSYSHVFDLPFGKFGIIAVDGCPDYGPSRPFNFFGALTTKKMDELERNLELMKAAKVRHTFLFAHYPLVTMQFQRSSKNTSFAELGRDISAYFSGHLHRLFAGLGRCIYAVQPAGFLELEVVDIKDHRMFRIVAVDHDVISFVDAVIDERPIILITNPVDARFLIKYHEDVTMAARSSHIRVLIFSSDELGDATVSIDQGPRQRLTKVSGTLTPLYTAPWEPSNLSAGLHQISVLVHEKSGRISEASHHFSTDGTVAAIGTFGERLALAALEIWVKRIYWSAFATLLFGCLIFPAAYVVYKKFRSAWDDWRNDSIRQIHDMRVNMLESGTFRSVAVFPLWTLRSLWLRLCLLYDRSAIFWVYLLCTLYGPVGPLLAGRLGSSDSGVSFLFLWGIWRSDTGWTRLLDTWTFSTFIMALQILPSYIILALFTTVPKARDSPLQSNETLTARSADYRDLHEYLLFKVFLFIWWVICGFKAAVIIRTYGFLVFIFGFGSAWHFVIFSFLLLQSIRTSRSASVPKKNN